MRLPYLSCLALLLCLVASAGPCSARSNRQRKNDLSFLLSPSASTLAPAPELHLLPKRAVGGKAVAAATAAAVAVAPVSSGRPTLVVPASLPPAMMMELEQQTQQAAAAYETLDAVPANETVLVAPVASAASALAGNRKLLRMAKPARDTHDASPAPTPPSRRLAAAAAAADVVNSDKFIRRSQNKFFATEVTVTTYANITAADSSVLLLTSTADITIWAWRVNIAGGVVAPGRAIQIVAHEVACSAHAPTCFISASGTQGKNGANGADGTVGDASKLDNQKGAPGSAGGAGGAGATGMAGGAISIYTELFDTRVQLFSSGGAGGLGGVGGKGGKGAQPSTTPPRSACEPSLSAQWQCIGETWCWGYKCQQEYYEGLKGYAGGDGGAAGNNGNNGQGGNAGAIVLHYKTLANGTTVGATNNPGLGGNQAARGTPGDGGEGGRGGLGTYRRRDKCAGPECMDCGSQYDCSFPSSGNYGAKGDTGKRGSVPALPKPGAAGATVPKQILGFNSTSQLGMPLPPTFLQLLLRQMRALYLQGDVAAAAEMGSYILEAGAANTSCVTGSVGNERGLCDNAMEQAQMLSYRMGQRLDVYGNSVDWVPTAGLAVIQAHLEKTVLPTLKTIEDKRAKLWDKSATQADKLQAVNDVIAQLQSRMYNLTVQEVAMSYELFNLSVPALNDGMELKNKYHAEMLTYQQQWQDAIQDKQADDRRWLIFTTVADFAAFCSAAVATAEDPAAALDLPGALGAVVADVQGLADPPAAIEVFLPFGDTSPAGAAGEWEQTRNQLQDDCEHRKILVKQEQLSKLLDAYADLPGSLEFRQAVAAFTEATQVVNQLQTKIAYLWSALAQNQDDREALTDMIAQAQAKIQQFQDPTLPETLSLVYEAYNVFAGMAQYWITQEAAAYRYSSLQPAQALNLAAQDYAGLLATHSMLQEQIMTDLNSNSAAEQRIDSRTIELSPTTLSNFTGMLATGTVSFVLPLCHRAFAWQSSVKVESVAVTADGARVRPEFAGLVEVPLTVAVTHSGRVDVLDVNAGQHSFSHLQRWTEYSADLQGSGRVLEPGVFTYEVADSSKPATDPLASLYTRLSPFTVFTLDFDTSEVDLSAVTRVLLRFKGTSRPMSTAGRTAYRAMCPVTTTSVTPSPSPLPAP